MGRRVLWGAGLLLAVLVFLRLFVVGLYVVRTDSMAPTLIGSTGGEYLVVRFDGARDLARQDVVALTPGGGEHEPRVKRLVGLPGERVALRNGDLWIGDAVLPPDAPRPDWVPVFDQQRRDVEASFRFTDAWTRAGDALELDARAVAPGEGRGLLYLRQPLHDDYFDHDGRFVEGDTVVGDAALEVTVELGEPVPRLRLGLTEMGDRFEVRLEFGADGAHASLLRQNAEGAAVLDEADLAWAPGPHRLRFANRDDALRFDLDGAPALAASYAQNAFMPLDHAHRGLSAPTERVFLGGEGGRATFRDLVVLRDLHYTPRGAFAVDDALVLGPSEVFVLGDNSSHSRDGRDWGPTPLREVLGHPLGVVWPPARSRPLGR
ncbi:MAG: signal peptidase I [Planctomycetes bacterium]|nr:signal peptidase I [Planctomycetota bacterium]